MATVNKRTNFEAINWKNNETPLNADNLNHIEMGIEGAIETLKDYEGGEVGAQVLNTSIDENGQLQKNVASGAYSTAAGKGTEATTEVKFVVGKYNDENEEADGALFVVGNGESDTERSNVVVVKDGVTLIKNYLQVENASINNIRTTDLETEDISATGLVTIPNYSDDNYEFPIDFNDKDSLAVNLGTLNSELDTLEESFQKSITATNEEVALIRDAVDDFFNMDGADDAKTSIIDTLSDVQNVLKGYTDSSKVKDDVNNLNTELINLDIYKSDSIIENSIAQIGPFYSYQEASDNGVQHISFNVSSKYDKLFIETPANFYNATLSHNGDVKDITPNDITPPLDYNTLECSKEYYSKTYIFPDCLSAYDKEYWDEGATISVQFVDEPIFYAYSATIKDLDYAIETVKELDESLATIAKSGNYEDLKDAPKTLPNPESVTFDIGTINEIVYNASAEEAGISLTSTMSFVLSKNDTFTLTFTNPENHPGGPYMNLINITGLSQDVNINWYDNYSAYSIFYAISNTPMNGTLPSEIGQLTIQNFIDTIKSASSDYEELAYDGTSPVTFTFNSWETYSSGPIKVTGTVTSNRKVVYDGTSAKTVTIPTKLPNPNKLTITQNGSTLGEYDGSEDLTIDIPEGSGTGTSESASIDVDSELSTTSTNPVQNKVITGALNGKIDYPDGKDLLYTHSVSFMGISDEQFRNKIYFDVVAPSYISLALHYRDDVLSSTELEAEEGTYCLNDYVNTEETVNGITISGVPDSDPESDAISAIYTRVKSTKSSTVPFTITYVDDETGEESSETYQLVAVE